MNICLILSAGMASRFGSVMPKQYNMLAGKEVIEHSIGAMRQAEKTDKIIISGNKGHIERLKEQYCVDITVGGETRNQSLRKGIEYIMDNYGQCEKIFINEAARPFITAEQIDDYFCKLDEYDAVVTAQFITDSLGNYNEHIVDRSQYYLLQAPEAFRFNLLYKHFSAGSQITATVQQLPPEARVYLNFDYRNNLKITYLEDLVVAEALMGCLH